MPVSRVVCLAVLVSVLACSRSLEPRQAENTRIIEGKVVEQLDGPPYSYLRIETKQGEVWAAVPIAAVPVGDEVEVVNGVALRDHESAAMQRRFETVVFGTLSSR